MHFHDLCYTFATIALGNVIDGKPLSTILGHVSAATTLDIYTHAFDKNKKAASQVLQEGLEI